MANAWEMWTVFGVLAAALVLFVGGWWRYDVVALISLLVLALIGIVPADEVFSGFGHAAVITVAAVLVVSRGLVNAGVINPIARAMGAMNSKPMLQVAALTGLVALCSGFMNNIGALAIFMPVAISLARKSGVSPSMLLMPMAFGSLLGGLMTMIGTPPNIIIATYRAHAPAVEPDIIGEPFRMFDFAPVGIAVALAGVAFIALIGWRLIPKRQPSASADELFDITDYLAELRVPKDSKLIGQSLIAFGRRLATENGRNDDGEGTARQGIETIIVGLYRNGEKIPAPSRYETLREGDVLTVEIDPDQLQEVIDRTGLELVGAVESEKGEDADESAKDTSDDTFRTETKKERTVATDEVKVVEAIVSPGSMLAGRTVEQLHLRWRHGLNLLAIARHGSRVKLPLRKATLQVGDILLLQGDAGSIHETLSVLGALPLADRELQIGKPRRVIPAIGIFAIAIVLTSIGAVPVQIAFAGAALLMVMTNLVSLRGAYEAIDWPVIVLLAAMIPVGAALEATGGAGMIADSLLAAGKAAPGWAMVLALLVVTMFLSDLINNAAAAVLMAPVAIGLATGLEASADPFLMAVAIGASCAFLTPIGHQSNTLVMGPGGYRFGDYWRMGLPLEVIIAAVAVPMIVWVWPLY
jgi:di/tricarboxylate transporter